MPGADGKPLFGRAWNITVAPKVGTGALGALQSSLGLDVGNLRCVFKAKKNLKPEPNTCTVQVYNLAPTSRRLLENESSLYLRLEAGYVDTGRSQIFLGEVQHAFTEWEGGSSITTVKTGDSAEEMQKARIHMSIGPSVSSEVALRAIVRALKIGAGNVDQAVATLKAKGALTMFGAAGSVISGNASDVLTDFCRSADLEWSIQDGNLQILDRGKPMTNLATELSSATGLIGSPSVDGKGIVKAKALISPDLMPGRKVSFNSWSVRGGYRIIETEFEGDTHGIPWYAHLACKKY